MLQINTNINKFTEQIIRIIIIFSRDDWVKVLDHYYDMIPLVKMISAFYIAYLDYMSSLRDITIEDIESVENKELANKLYSLNFGKNNYLKKYITTLSNELTLQKVHATRNDHCINKLKLLITDT